jgi:hypothetical protein
MAKKAELAIADQSVPNILDVLKKELQEIKKVSGSNYRTSGNVDGVNIKNETSIPNLIKVYGSIKVSEQAYNQAADDLGLVSYPQYTAQGCTVEDWKKDIDLRIKIITQEDRKKELEEAIKEMEQFLTEEDRKAQVLAKIAGIIGK